jgi:Patatin-like phospholipase
MLSGGGVRSASFSLGVLQGLARFGLLGQFHYQSTVSGGGYIGSWLSAWRTIDSDGSIFGQLNSLELNGRDPPQIESLRHADDPLVPAFGLMSLDTWRRLSVYVRNLIINWFMFAPFFAGCLLLPRWYGSLSSELHSDSDRSFLRLDYALPRI